MTTYFKMSQEEKDLVNCLIGDYDGLRIRLLEAIEASGSTQKISLKYFVCDPWEWDLLINLRVLVSVDEHHWGLSI